MNSNETPELCHPSDGKGAHPPQVPEGNSEAQPLLDEGDLCYGPSPSVANMVADLGFQRSYSKVLSHKADPGFQRSWTAHAVTEPGKEKEVVQQPPLLGYGTRLIPVPLMNLSLRLGSDRNLQCPRLLRSVCSPRC